MCIRDSRKDLDSCKQRENRRTTATGDHADGEEIEIIRNRPVQGQYIQPTDNRDVINFKNYKKNPIQFLERVDENLTRIRENRWTVIRSLMDEYFKEIHDNWWTATRHEVQSRCV